MANNINAEEFPEVFGGALAVSILTILYAMVIKMLSYTAEQKIRFKYLNN